MAQGTSMAEVGISATLFLSQDHHIVRPDSRAVNRDGSPARGLLPVQEGNEPCKEKTQVREGATRMRLQWREAMCRNMDIPNGYQKVSVLMIKWSKDLDQLDCGEEVEELRSVFDKSFNYTTTVAELHNKYHPQLQLCNAVNNFIKEHDGKNNLLIIYYNGHGKLHDEDNGRLELYPTDKWSSEVRGASWNQIHQTLLTVPEGDVLAVLDTCYASNVHKQVLGPARTYELLAASAWDKPTGSKERSFTKALIQSLKDLLLKRDNGSFTTLELCNRISRQPKRLSNPSHLYSLLDSSIDHMIILSPLFQNKNDSKQKEPRPENSSLTLNFGLNLPDAELTLQDIEYLTANLPKVFRDAKLDLSRIDWRSLTFIPHHPFSKMADVAMTRTTIQRFRKKVLTSKTSSLKRKADTQEEEKQQQHQQQEAGEENLLPSPAPEKRRWVSKPRAAKEVVAPPTPRASSESTT